jgi:hypothetical protein
LRSTLKKVFGEAVVRPALLSLLVVSCGGGSSFPDAGSDSCLNRPGIDAWSNGLARTSPSGNLKVTLLSGDPTPPARGTNTWTVSLTDGTGNAITGAQPDAVPYMPEHGHGSSVTPDMTSTGGPDYTVAPLYFFMPGIWQVTLSATPDAGPSDQVQVEFCISG